MRPLTGYRAVGESISNKNRTWWLLHDLFEALLGAEPINDNSHGRLYVRSERILAVDSKHFLAETKTFLGCSWISRSPLNPYGRS